MTNSDKSQFDILVFATLNLKKRGWDEWKFVEYGFSHKLTLDQHCYYLVLKMNGVKQLKQSTSLYFILLFILTLFFDMAHILYLHRKMSLNKLSNQNDCLITPVYDKLYLT